MAEPVRLLLAVLCALAGTMAAEARQLGDFGRVAPGVLNDDLIPAFERVFRGTGRTPSAFNMTDEEDEMRDRIWRFLVAPHASGWAIEYSVEVKPAAAGVPQGRYDDRYYRWLSGARYASSHVRFNTMTDHAGADIGTLPGVFDSICVVRAIDRQRLVAFEALPQRNARTWRDLEARRLENDIAIERFVVALAYRYDAYSYALDHLLVETPHVESVTTDARLRQLAVWVELALAHDFCGHGAGGAHAGGAALPGRQLMNPPSEGPYRK